MLTAEAENGVQVTRNSSFFKKVPSSENTPVYNETAPDKAKPQNNKEMTDVVESEAATRRYPEHVRKRPNKLDDYVCK